MHQLALVVCYRGLTESIPYHRLFNSPISEGAIVGTACGYAVSGGRACVELMYCDFLGRAGDEVFNQISKWQSMSAGILSVFVVRDVLPLPKTRRKNWRRKGSTKLPTSPLWKHQTHQASTEVTAALLFRT